MSEEKKGFFSRLVEGLTKTRNNIASVFDDIFSGFSSIDDDFYEELEEVLVMADIGIHTTEMIIEDLKVKVKENHLKEPSECREYLIRSIKEQMAVTEDAYEFDTAGRLHNKKNLMEELKKINRIIDREYPDAFRETMIVLDGTTGQNALVQAKQFKEVADITGIILTKLDGTAKGGIAIAIQSELGVPVKYIGIGEKIEDLQKFDSDSFVDALFQ